MLQAISSQRLEREPAIRFEALTSFDFDAPEYRDLFARSDATAFQHPVWLETFYRVLAPALGARPAIITGRDIAGRLVLLIPLVVRRKSGVTLLEAADLGVSDYAAPVLDPSLVPNDALREAVRAALPAHDLLRIGKVRDEHLPVWQASLGATGEEADYGAHAAEHGPDYQTWRAAALDASFVRNLDRKAKRFFKLPGAAVRTIDGAAERAAAVEAIRRDRAGRFPDDPIQSDEVFAFYRELAANGSDVIRIYALETEGERIGHTLCVADRGRLHYLLIGCDYERHGRHSPGYILYEAMMEDWAQSGGTVFDFTIGDEPFKADFGTRRTQMFQFSRANGWLGKLARVALDARKQRART